jgi:hypothetical protein
MTGSAAEYAARAGMYQLLSSFAQPQFSQALDETLSDPALRDILTSLAAVAFGGYVRLADGDPQKAFEIIARERQAAEDLRDL